MDDSEKRILKIFIDERNGSIKLRDEMNSDYIQLRLNNIKELREFYKTILFIAAAILGVITVIDKPALAHIHFFYIGLIFSGLLIIFIATYLREVLDEDNVEYGKDQDRYI